MEPPTATSNSVKVKTTGVYAADLTPGTYLKTRTGVVRGEELFSRPDLERPWRSAETQKSHRNNALKEKEIEELMRLCSQLRTELGNVKADARTVEYAASEKAKREVAQKDKEIAEARDQLEKEKIERSKLIEATEHQIRLLKSQNESEILGLNNEVRLARERATELATTYQTQVEDLKSAYRREMEYIESRFNARLEEKNAELNAVRESAKAAEGHYQEQVTQTKNLLGRIEADCNERLRAAEQRLDALRQSKEDELQKERKEKEAALAEVRSTAEQLAVALADSGEVMQRFKLWNNYIIAGLDKYYRSFVESVPELAAQPVDPQLHEVPELYAPRSATEDPDAKITMERIVYRLLQLHLIKSFSAGGINSQSGGGDAAAEVHLSHVEEKQDRLQRAIKETDEKCVEIDSALNSVLSRLYFFCDNLENAVAFATTTTRPPPMREVVFVCLSIPNGSILWADDAETMRSAVALLFNTVRLKMAQYGAYESYSDELSMLLAFEDAVAACRFCTECQEWLMQVPWPPSLLRSPLCREELDKGQRAIFSGLRVAMSLHAGESFIQRTAIPLAAGGSHVRYYGRAISQIIHISALTQGGQILMTKPAWDLCVRRKHDLGQLVVSQLGPFPIVSFNSETGVQEKQNIELLQIVPTRLKNRQFKPTSKLTIPSVSSLSGLRKTILSTEIKAIESRRDSLGEAMELLKEEYKGVKSQLTSLTSRARKTKAQFHLLPPPEMVTQMNDMYSVMEQIAEKAQVMADDLQNLEVTQEDLDMQTKWLQEYFRQQSAVGSKEDELRTEMEVTHHRAELAIKDMNQKHRRDMDKLTRAVQEREQTIRSLYQCTVDPSAHR